MYQGVTSGGEGGGDEDENGAQQQQSVNERRSIGTAKSRATSVAESMYASTILSIEEENRKKKKTLNDQQWVLQRKKIGLSRRSTKTLQAKIQQEGRKMSAITFIETHFNRKECVHYVHQDTAWNANLPRVKPCFCGAQESEHKTRARHKLDDVNYKEFRSDLILEEELENGSVEADSGIINMNESDTSSLSELLKSPENDKFRKKGCGQKTLIVDVDHLLKRNKSVAPAMTDAKNVVSSIIQLGDRVEKDKKENQPKKNTKSDWKANLAMQEFPTNAYGQIEFDGNVGKAAKYVRLADNTTMASVKDFIVDYWNLMKPRPHLALSIVGGAKNFKMDGRKKETFKAGLIAAARATNAWVLSGGTNTGVMKLVGEAVNEGQFLVSDGARMRRGLKAIGICAWGYTHNNQTLINQVPAEFHKVRYNSNVEIRHKKSPPLSPDHTHFLMVDDGYRNRYFGAGGIREFISAFEKMLMDPSPKGLGVPVITLLLEGGTDAIFEVKDNLESGQPCVVVEGSGRAADILAYAHRHVTKNSETGVFTLKEGHVKHIEQMMQESFADRLVGEIGVTRKKNFMNWVIECIRYSDLITVFDIRSEENMDKKILSALLKGENLSIQSQMYLSMVWNRVDIAEEKIFSDRNFEWQEGDLDEVMTKALLMERVAFVELLILNGFSIHKFLTVKRLRDLYNDAVIQHPHLLEQLERFVGPCSYIYLRNIHKYLVFVMKSHQHHLYKLDRAPTKLMEKQILANCSKSFDEPFFELFIWSVLCNKSSLSDYFWLKSGSPLVTAVFAASFYGILTKMYNLQQNERLRELKLEYVDKANSIMKLAFAKDQDKAVSLVDKRYERFGQRSLIKISYIGHLKSFIANTPCQEAVRGTWQRGFIKINPWVAILTIFCPFLVLTPAFQYLPLGDDGGNLDHWQKIYVFYRTPMVKYIGTFISYAIFLMLYTSVALFNFEWEYRTSEILVYVWLSIMIVDEMREVFLEPSSVLARKFRDHLSSVWNKLDFIIYIFAIVGFILKNSQATFQVARIFFAVNAALLYCRLFRVYHASWSLGPKLVIFHRMIPEIITFMLLLIIFILGYGTASQALLNPATEFNIAEVPEMFSNIIYLPYWQMYGELSLESIVHENKTVCYENAFCEDFTVYNHITIPLLAVYLLVGNVMLLNLLIAIFTSVFEDVQENSKEVWKYEMYRLVEEYDQKPGLAPPFVIIEDLYKLGKQIWKWTCRTEKENLDLMMSGTLETLDLFERDSLNAYLIKKSKDESSKMDSKMVVMEDKITKVLEYLEENPVNAANDWGEEITTDVKLYTSSSSDSEGEDEFTNNRTSNQKSRKRKTSRHVLFKENEQESEGGQPKTTTKPVRRVTSGHLKRRLEGMDEKITSLEEKTSATLSKMEGVLTSIQLALNKQ